VRVRVANQPTFTRYIFELPELTGVAADRGKDRLTLSFAKSLRFDLSDAKLAQPKVVAAINASRAEDGSMVRFAFSQPADIRTFREDANYVVDVTPISAKAGAGPNPLAGLIAPETVPAQDAPGTRAPAAAAAPKAAEAPEPPQPVQAKEPEPAVQPRSASRDPNRPSIVELRRQGDNLRLLFPFGQPTPAAVFQRADTLWLVFDTAVKIDAGVLSHDQSKTIRSVTVTRDDNAQVVRLKLERPRLTSVEPQDNGWLVTVGEAMAGATKPLVVARNIVAPGRTSITIPFDDPRQQHRLADPEMGDKILVVTGLGPARGLIKSQEFVELRALATAQGIAILPFADDLKAELSVDKVLLMRPQGLTLSDAAAPQEQKAARAVTFDTKLWELDREGDFTKREFALVAAAADAPFTRRSAARLDLARFYFSRQMYPEAKAVLDTAIADDKPTSADPTPLVLRAVANIMLGRVEAAQKDLADPAVGNQNDAQLWRAMAFARQGKWAEARDAFRTVEGALGTLPLELQRMALQAALRASIEVGDFAGASHRLNDFQVVGTSAEFEPAVAVLTGRLAEGMGRTNDALAAYRFAAGTGDRPEAAQARLREIALRYSNGELKKPEVINQLEVLTTAWRGDETEVEALQMLARLYTEENRYRDAFHVMRVALSAYPQSPYTRTIQDAAAKTFDGLFLAGRGDALPAIDALSLFYDFRDLTPIGRRGDEMIRRLAERLVSVDLLDQAAELLQYQVDNRLQGAARAQVATRLAVIDLLNRKPDKAQAVLRATRTADLANEIRVPRLLIEARALSDLGRHDFALEVIAGIDGRESLRLRSDIYWAARRWQKAAEHIELLYGDRWKSFEPLDAAERSDILRAGVAYALADDKIGMARLRDKYAAKMADGTDRRAFDLVTSGLGPNSSEFREVARIVASGDTLAGFLRDLKMRYPDMQGVLASGAAKEPKDLKDAGESKAEAPKAEAPKAEAPAKPDPSPTGSVRRPGAQRLSAR
jgi:tetratricopeptide (TPR) repeat protein